MVLVRSLISYPEVPREPQSFKRVKRVSVPQQSMSLKDIIKRFVRKESLPIEHDAMYCDHLGDLEKIAREDITQRMERLDSIKVKIASARKRMDDKAAAEKAAAEAVKPKVDIPPVSTVTG